MSVFVHTFSTNG